MDIPWDGSLSGQHYREGIPSKAHVIASRKKSPHTTSPNRLKGLTAGRIGDGQSYYQHTQVIDIVFVKR
jgi:hypothetical protein